MLTDLSEFIYNFHVHPADFPVAVPVAADEEILAVWRNNTVRFIRRRVDLISHIDRLRPGVVVVFKAAVLQLMRDFFLPLAFQFSAPDFLSTVGVHSLDYQDLRRNHYQYKIL